MMSSSSLDQAVEIFKTKVASVWLEGSTVMHWQEANAFSPVSFGMEGRRGHVSRRPAPSAQQSQATGPMRDPVLRPKDQAGNENWRKPWPEGGQKEANGRHGKILKTVYGSGESTPTTTGRGC